jgi:hypothetical protein
MARTHATLLALVGLFAALAAARTVAFREAFSDPSLRFSTAFDLSARIGATRTVSLDACKALCEASDACEGVYAWTVAGVSKCILLSDLGTGKGVKSALGGVSLEKKVSCARDADACCVRCVHADS